MSSSVEALQKAIELEKSALEKYQEAITKAVHKETRETLEKIAKDRAETIDTLHWMIMAESGKLESDEEVPKETGADRLAAGKCPFSRGELEKMGFDMTHSKMK